MKFGAYLKGHRVNEWKNEYVDYRTLKKLIKRAAPDEDKDEDSDREDDSAEDPTPSTPQTAYPLFTESPTTAEPSRSNNADDSSKLSVMPSLDKLDSTGDVSESPLSMRNVTPSTARSTSYLRKRSHSLQSNTSSRASARGARRRKGTADGIGKRTFSNSFRRVGGYRFPQGTPLDKIMPHLNENERKLFSVFERELEKVNRFWGDREQQAVDRTHQIEDQLDELERHRKADEQYRLSHVHSFYVPEAVQTIRNAVPDAVTAGIRRVVTHGENRATAKSGTDASNANQDAADAHHSLAAELRHWRPESYMRAKRALKEAIFEEYRYLGLLRAYRNLNRQGFAKALKKAEKVTRIPCSQVFMERVNNSPFVASTRLDEMTAKAEQLFAENFEGGSRKKARERLRLLGVKKTHHGSAGRAGTWIGLAIPALVAGIYKSFDPDFRARTPEWPALMQLFGALLTPVALACLLQLNLTVWHRARINFPLIFELDLRTMIDWHQFLELPALLFCLLCYAFWLSMNNFWPDKLSPDVWPLVWIVTALVILVNPLPILHLRARYWLIWRIGRLFTAGLLPVGFTDFWLGDQLTSLYYLFVVCTYHRNFDGVPPSCNTNSTWASPVLASIPAFLRLGQSIRRYVDSEGLPVHAWNAGKYSATIIYFWMYFAWRINGSNWDGRVVCFIIFAIINSSYSTIWDLALDWNLLKRHSRYAYLRPDLVYKNAIWTYPAAICLDTLMRFSWIIYLAPQPSVQLRGFLVAFTETLRRFIWNFYRLESEQCGNADAYRVTRDVPLPFALTPKEEASRGHHEEHDEMPGVPKTNTLSSWALHPVTRVKESLVPTSSNDRPARPKRKSTLLDRVRGVTSESSDQEGTGSDFEEPVEEV